MYGTDINIISPFKSPNQCILYSFESATVKYYYKQYTKWLYI